MQPTVGTNKLIDVVGAAIVRNGKVLCARRGSGKSLAGYWEFPGGKAKPGESRREALRREIEWQVLHFFLEPAKTPQQVENEYYEHQTAQAASL